jgi:hypothetical protein
MRPQAKMQPVTLDSFTPPLAKSFALRQLQLMSDKDKLLSPQAAFLQAEKELAPQIL